MSRFMWAQHHCTRSHRQYILARSQVTMPRNRSVNRSSRIVAARLVRTAKTVKVRATNVHSQAFDFRSCCSVKSHGISRVSPKSVRRKRFVRRISRSQGVNGYRSGDRGRRKYRDLTWPKSTPLQLSYDQGIVEDGGAQGPAHAPPKPSIEPRSGDRGRRSEVRSFCTFRNRLSVSV